MAKPGFFARIANLWRGFLSLWVSGIETKNPEIAYENSINSMIEKYSLLKKATASIIRRRENISDRLRKELKDLEQITAEINTAVETGQDEIALILISKQNTLGAAAEELREEFSAAESDADEAKSALLNMQAKINKLKSEKDRMLAKMKSAEARIQIQDQLEGLSVDAEIKALDNVREHIGNLAAEAQMGTELAGESLDGKLAALRRQTGDVTAKKQLEELKQKRAAAAAQQAAQTTAGKTM